MLLSSSSKIYLSGVTLSMINIQNSPDFGIINIQNLSDFGKLKIL